MLGGFIVMGCLGATVGIGLALASKIFYVYIDPKIEAVDEVLPGANCGGCGFPGCSSNAEAIVAGKSSPSSCVAAGPEVAAEIAEIIGAKLEVREPDIASPGCRYGVQDADLKYIYDGIYDCKAAALLNGGSKLCPVGCLGLGSCVKACPFGALSIGPDNLPVVDEEICTGCGACERVCPKHIITLMSNSRAIQHEYTTDECTAPCQRACPAGIDIPSYIFQIREGNYEEALRIIKRTNPFPAICGRICVHPCEYECRRNLVDEPVAINHLKRFVSDHERKSGKRIHVPRAPETEKRIAVIGGGAEGLTAAYLLNRLGHSTTVYEATSRLGGILLTGLPENRLPREVLEWEINGILDAGVEAITNKMLGRDFTIESLLKDEFSAVFVATGGWDTQMQLSEPFTSEQARPLPGVQLLLNFVLSLRDGKSPSTDNDVMILGGGLAALEAARAIVKEGSKRVAIVVRTSLKDAPFSEKDVKGAEEEGIRFYFECALTKMAGVGDRLTQVELTHLSSDDKGKSQKEIVEINTLLIGTGRFPELIYIPQNNEEVNGQIKWETLVPYAGPVAKDDIGLFRPGEVISDYKAIVEAIGSGRRAANSIQRFFAGEPVKAPENMICATSSVLNIEELEPVPTAHREHMPIRPTKERINDPSAEIALGYSEEQAVKEAKRCLQCGLICYLRTDRGGHLH